MFHDPDSPDPTPEHNLELVMPFVCVASAGGPYDDEAFVAGCQFGQLATALLNDPASVCGHTMPVRPALVAQLDLLAMEHGYTMTSDPWADDPDHWTMVTFHHAPDDDPNAMGDEHGVVES